MSSLHQHAKDLFLAALSRSAADRPAFLDEACGTDATLRREVESLLAFHSESRPDDHTPTGDTGPAGAREAFSPGEIFASRYRMITRIGRGGMGDVWRADDLVLDTPVALKLIHATGPDAREQILNEVRLARQITHPGVCRVFDVGTHADQIFFSMELVQGEDLAGLLKRVGRIPCEKVVDIGRQLCEGLAAAHARGVLHRDLKPANVLIDDDGRIRITDFGIAVTRRDRHRYTPMGTPGYMAPEQLTPGAILTERTDLYALGLILYELVTGQHPFKQARPGHPTPRPSALVSEIDPQLGRVILRALSPDPLERPASAEAMAGSLAALGGTRWSRRRVLSLAAAVVAVVVLAGIGWAFMARDPVVPLTEQDTIVIADFTNTTGEPVFDGALKVALAVALEQSPFLKVFPDERVRETLRLMGRSPEEHVTRAMAREIAQREQLKALLSGSIAGLGRNYVLAIEAINAQTGDVMAREQIEATSKEDVLTALGSAAARLREKLGESLASVQKFDAPLARATTSSLEALHAYSLALDHGTVNPRREAIPQLERAIELDPQFALALALLATVHANTGQTALAPEYARKAFELRDRVSERERFFIAFRYYRDATQDWTRALELARVWTSTYPREAFAFNSLGTALARFGRHEEALEPYREAIRLDPRFAAPYSNLATALIALNRYDEAKGILNQALSMDFELAGVLRLSFTIAFLEGDAASMERFATLRLNARDATAFGWQAHAAEYGGEIEKAHRTFREGIDMALQADFKEVAAQMGVEDAEAHATVGQCADTRREVAEALESSRDNFTLERGSRALAFCGAESEALALVRELERRFPDATLTARVTVPLAQAALAVRQRAPQRALELLETVRAYDHTQKAELWPPYHRGLAHLQQGAAADAAVDFESVIDHRGEDPDSPLLPLAHIGLARAEAMSGDHARASQSYDRAFAVWRNADPNLQPLEDARRERARLN
jgi:tetratricopeptide (TPR) repeat protein